MSLERLFTVTFIRYYKTLSGNPPNQTETWAARDATAIGGRLSNVNLDKEDENGKISIKTYQRLRIRPLTFITTDRILIGDDVYNNCTYEDIDEMGRQAVIRMEKMAAGTKAEMGIL